MKVALIVIILLAAGVAGLVALTASGGAAQTGISFRQLQEGAATDASGKPRRVAMTVQVTDLHSRFDPMEFDAIDVGKSENESQDETDRRYREFPRMRVAYQGHDKIPLERHNHVRIEGIWDRDAKVFRAEKLSTQCPSHYESKAPAPTVDAR